MDDFVHMTKHQLLCTRTVWADVDNIPCKQMQEVFGTTVGDQCTWKDIFKVK